MAEEATNIYGDDIHLTTVDASTIYDKVIAALEKGVSEPLYPGDERRIYGEALCAVFVQLYNKIDDCGRQTMLQYARGEVLDAIGARLGVTRLSGSPAKTILKFSVSEPLDENIIIPKWTKAKPSSEVYFATDEVAVLEAGAYSVEVPASSTGVGEKFNGYAENTITTLVNLVPYISKVTNLYETAEGDDGEPYTTEGDDRFRERIRLAPNKLSVAGPEQAYIYYAMTADSSIVDCKAVSEYDTIKKTLPVVDNKAYVGGSRLLADTLIVCQEENGTALKQDTDYSAEYEDDLLTINTKGSLKDASSIYVEVERTMEGRVKIVPLLENGAAPSDDLKEKILDIVNASDIRPMTDVVTVEAPRLVKYDLEFTYWTEPDDEEAVVTNIEDQGGAIERFNAWQTSTLGRDINPDVLRMYVMNPEWADNPAGAVRIEVTEPKYTEVGDTEVASFSGHIKVNHIVKNGVV